MAIKPYMAKILKNDFVWQSFLNKKNKRKKNYGQAECDQFHVCLLTPINILRIRVN